MVTFENVEILETKPVYVVWTNTDLTEGRGTSFPLHVCEKLSTATRLAKGKSVMGTDCPISESNALRIKFTDVQNHFLYDWFTLGRVIPPNKEDAAEEEKLEKQRRIQAAKEAAIEKAKAAGLSDEDIEALRK